MTFELPVDEPCIAQTLRGFEPQAPKAMKAALVQAANELDGLIFEVESLRRQLDEARSNKALYRTLAQELDIAASLRIGAMDSNSKAEEVSRQVRQTLVSVAERLRSLA